MNIITSSIAALVLSFSVAIPSYAQQYVDYSAKTFKGGACTMYAGKSAPKSLACNQVVLTGQDMDTDTLNFHFETKDGFGITFITTKEVFKSESGPAYKVLAVTLQRDGKLLPPREADGYCLFPDRQGDIVCGNINANGDITLMGIYKP